MRIKLQIAKARALPVLICAGLLYPCGALAQDVDVGGLAYLDYYYTLASPDPDGEGRHGFTYRRLYLTADFTLSDDFWGRARLEANDGSLGSNGPVPFVKDLWLSWNYAGNHDVTLGVTPTPAFGVSEEVWGYRSLEKTVLDLQGVVGSRDFGIRFDGPMGSSDAVRYSVMLANNSGQMPESDNYKRGYAQIEYYPTETLSFTLGADHAGYDDDREAATQVNAFAGIARDLFRVGVEAFWRRVTFESIDDDARKIGVSVFGVVDVSPKWEAVVRLDRVHNDAFDAEFDDTFVLAGVSYAPIANVRIIPNLWLYESGETDEAETLGRVTVEVQF